MNSTTTKRIPTSTRVLIQLVVDRCLDVNIGGTHWAYLDMQVGEATNSDYLLLILYTMPVGKTHTDTETRRLQANLDALWNDTKVNDQGDTAKDRVEKQLNAILEHLDGLAILAMHERKAAGVVA